MLGETARSDNSGKSRLSAAKAGFAGKKIIIYLTITSLLNLVGCSYQQQMTPGEYKFDENLDLQVTTKDTTYAISSDDYYYANDTLFVKVPIQIDDRTSAKQKINIPLESIETIEAQKLNVLGTSLIVGSIVLLVLLLSLGGDWGPSGPLIQ